jgi:uncharacterized protein (TIGR02246 family)
MIVDVLNGVKIVQEYAMPVLLAKGIRLRHGTPSPTIRVHKAYRPMSRQFLILLPLILCLVGCSDQHVGTRDDTFIRSGISEVLDRQADAWNSGDLERFVADYDAEATFISRGRLIRGRDALLDRYRSAYPESTRGVLSFSEIDFDSISPVAALVSGRYTLSQKNGDADTGRFTLLFQNIDGHWRITHDHSSASPESSMD